MSLSGKATFAPSAFVLLLFVLLFFPVETRADPVAITSGTYRISSPFRVPEPRYISMGFQLQGTNFLASGSVGDGPNRRVRTNCQLPCRAGSSFTLDAPGSLFIESPTSVLHINGQNHHGFFEGGLQFQTGSVTIPLDAGAEVTLTTSFTMTGMLSFEGFDLQRLVFTGFEYETELFGSGTVNISLFFSPISQEYHISSVQYNFTAVPEPTTLFLLGTGLAGLAARRRRRRRIGNKELNS